MKNKNGNLVIFACTNPEFDSKAERAGEQGRQSLIDTGGRVDPDQNLCAVQMESMGAGYTMARLFENVYGFCLRDTNNMGGGRLSPNFPTPAEALRWAYEWYLETPSLREVIIYESEFEKKFKQVYEEFMSQGPTSVCQICKGMNLNPWTFGNSSELKFHTTSVHGIGTPPDLKVFPPQDSAGASDVIRYWISAAAPFGQELKTGWYVKGVRLSEDEQEIGNDFRGWIFCKTKKEAKHMTSMLNKELKRLGRFVPMI